MTQTRPVAARARPGPAHLWTANLFGIPYSLAGLTQCWSTAQNLGFVAAWPDAVLWALTALVYLGLLLLYAQNVVRTRRTATEIGERTFGPFTALILIIPMLLGVALAGVAPRTAMAVFLVSMILVALYGGWPSGQGPQRPFRSNAGTRATSCRPWPARSWPPAGAPRSVCPDQDA